MDDKLKNDISEYYFSEYRKTARSEKTGLLKWLDKANDWAEEKAGKYGLSAMGLGLFASFVVGAFNFPVGGLMLAAWTANIVGEIVSAAKDGNLAQKRIDADIENGKLPELYGAVLDTQIRELTEQKAQLPGKGAAVEAFDRAQEPKAAPAAPAPSPAPTYFPSIH